FTNDVETSPPQQETSAQSTVSPEQLEPLSVQQESSDQHPTPSENVEPSPVQQGAPTQPEELPEETDPSPSQQESSAQHPKPTEWVGPSPVQHQHPTQPPGASTDGAAQPSVHSEVTFSHLGPGEVEHPVLSNITVEPLDPAVVLTLEPSKSLNILQCSRRTLLRLQIPLEG
ncbi:putative uncharacterized protein FLJ43944, partial [Delphinapterus leucas]|uniref:Leucine-rich repeat-containing protein 37 N-terminal domain-containing protein n=1 Tax=Delphinapterus leucas TaxID=9749 RepID=A0A7F8KAX7_DELLE